jgi:mycoredoxin
VSDAADVPEASPVTVYWRPGCGFCSSLLRSLERAGLEVDRVDIWEDEEAAAFVRSVARGNETVPTVRVGNLAMVNPSGPEVLAAVAQEAPEHLPEGYEPVQPGLLARAITKVLG